MSILIPAVTLQAVADGVFKAELNELLVRELAEDGYSGVEVRRTSTRTEIIIRATRTQKVLGTHPRFQPGISLAEPVIWNSARRACFSSRIREAWCACIAQIAALLLWLQLPAACGMALRPARGSGSETQASRP